MAWTIFRSREVQTATPTAHIAGIFGLACNRAMAQTSLHNREEYAGTSIVHIAGTSLRVYNRRPMA